MRITSCFGAILPSAEFFVFFDAVEGNCKIPRCLTASNALGLHEDIASAMKKCIKTCVNK